MVQIPLCLYSSFKEISNNTSHAQIRVQRKKLCHQQVGEENKSLSRFCCDKASDKALSRKNPDFIAIELATNSVTTKPNFFTTKLVTKLFRDKTQILSQQS